MFWLHFINHHQSTTYLASEASPRWLHFPRETHELKLSPRWFKSYFLNHAFDERISSFSGMLTWDVDDVFRFVVCCGLFGMLTIPIENKPKNQLFSSFYIGLQKTLLHYMHLKNTLMPPDQCRTKKALSVPFALR